MSRAQRNLRARALYPHGAGQLGVQVSGPAAATVANAILAGGS